MDESQADRSIEMLGRDLELAMKELEKFGKFGLRRLFQACECIVIVPPGGHWQDATMSRALALGRLGKLYPELLLELVQEVTRREYRIDYPSTETVTFWSKAS